MCIMLIRGCLIGMDWHGIGFLSPETPPYCAAAVVAVAPAVAEIVEHVADSPVRVLFPSGFTGKEVVEVVLYLSLMFSWC